MRVFKTMCFLALLILGVFSPGCRYSPGTLSDYPLAERSGEWVAEDLRLLRSVAAEQAEDFIVALGARRSSGQLQFRLDLFESIEHEVFLAVNSGGAGSARQLPGGAATELAWDVLVHLSANGMVSAMDAAGSPLPDLKPACSGDPFLDYVVCSLQTSSLPLPFEDYQVQAFLFAPGENTLIDRTPVVRLGQPPPQPVNVILAFWDALPAYTPAQALRRWDGAHTGPFGRRHGLRHLLQASSEAGVPVVLLDLAHPDSLAGLDAVGGLEQVRSLQESGLVILPEVAYGDPQAAQISLEFSRRAAGNFGLKTSRIVYGTANVEHLAGYQAAFAVLPDPGLMLLHDEVRLIPLPGADFAAGESGDIRLGVQVDPDQGLTATLRRALLESAALTQAGQVLVLGGSLTQSAWADQMMAAQAFRYLTGQPWIRVLGESDLLNGVPVLSRGSPACEDLLCLPPLPPFVPFDGMGQAVESGITLIEMREILFSELQALPPSQVTELVWRAYLQLTTMTGNEKRLALSANYLGNVGHLVRAAKWAQSPAPIQDCEQDLDYDGVPECVLASGTVFLVVRLDGGRVTTVFSFTPDGVTQWIAPLSQFALGMGDPFDWQLNLGAAADAGEVSGGWVDPKAPFARHHPQIGRDELYLRREDGASTRIIRLLSNGFELHYEGQDGVVTRLPVMLDPLSRSYPGWSTAGSQDEYFPDCWRWISAQDSSIAVEIEGGQLSVDSVFDSLEWMTVPEDPNRAYPRGHYLAYPVAVIEILGDNTFKMRITGSDCPGVRTQR